MAFQRSMVGNASNEDIAAGLNYQVWWINCCIWHCVHQVLLLGIDLV